MKKTLSLILALLMSVSTATVALANEEVAIDAVENGAEEVVSPYADAVKYLEHYNIYKGNENGLDTESDVNRWQMALFAARIATGWTEDDKWENGDLNSSEFTDLAGTYAEDVYGAISYVNQMGIIEGYGDGTFGPTKNITYQDALTIVVRTLGYKNLEYPWGYIQKAVELDLVKDVAEVAYTDPLTRGETAQVIYNALTAPIKNGNGATLGLASFGIEFKWENVIITASDRDTFTVEATKKTVPAGFVAFQIVDDGELDDEVYFAKADEDFGLTADHADDLAVGASYKVFFEKDADSELVNIIDYKPNYVGSAWNFGNDIDPEIEALFDEYKLVDSYTSSKYLSNVIATANEIVVVNAFGSITVLEEGKKDSDIGINMLNGDVVRFIVDEDGVYEIDKILWHWNPIVERYYQLVVEGVEIGVRYMDEEAEAELLAQIADSTKDEVTYDAFANADKASVDADSAYASIDVYEVNGKAYGIYEEYKFGYFANANVRCPSCKADKAGYTISDAITVVNGDNVITSFTEPKFSVVAEDACGHTAYAKGWINPEFDANATEDGYADGYVIYSADATTGEIKILKHITEDNSVDADSYVAYGSVKGYSVSEEYVVINGEKLYFNYETLEGAKYVFANENKANYSAFFRFLFNQYVKYVVVDGALVHIEVVDDDDTNLFVVEKYVGISSNGYIVVDGYFTAAGTTLERKLINTYDNSYTGDHYYFMTPEKAAAAFKKGSVYAVSSVEADGSLNVQIVGGINDNEYVINTASKYVADGDKNFALSAKDCAEGYLSLTKTVDGAAKTSNIRNKEYTYILIGEAIGNEYAPIAVYTGKIANPDWYVKGERIGSGDVYFVVNAEWEGFELDKTASGVVALLGDYYWTADFDGATADDWYVLGLAKYTVNVFNFFTAGYETVKVENYNLAEGIYKTIDGTIVYDDTYAAADIQKLLKEVYADDTYGSADYHIDDLGINVTADTTSDDLVEAVSASVCNWIFKHTKYDDLCGGISAKKMIVLKDGKIDDIVDLTAANIKALDEDATVTLNNVFYIYNPSSTKAIVYAVVGADADVTTSSSKTDNAFGTTDIIEVGTDAYIDVTADVKVDYVDGKATSAKINSVTFSYIGEATDDIHNVVYQKGYNFGASDTCTEAYWMTTVNGENVYGNIENGMYDNHENEDICDLVKTVTVDFDDITIGNEWKQINVKFTANRANQPVVHEITLCAIVENGKLVFNVDHNNGCVEIGGAGVNFVPRAEIVK